MCARVSVRVWLCVRKKFRERSTAFERGAKEMNDERVERERGSEGQIK